MSRKLRVAAAQMGPIHLSSPRPDTIQRMLALLDTAASQGAHIVLFPETALTTFFPRHLFTDQQKLDSFFEHGDDIVSSPNTAPLFSRARELRVDISVGYAEREKDGRGFNTCVYFSAKEGKILSKYRKVHLPGTKEPFPGPDAINQLEKRYFEPGDIGFQAFRVPHLISGALRKSISGDIESTEGKGDPIVGMLICNDRRWPEAWRSYGLQGVELVLCGYNTTSWAPDLWGQQKPISREAAEEEAVFHHKLVMQANSYMNSCFSVSSARAGADDGKYDMIGGSCIVDPQGHILAEAKTKDDEIVIADIDLEDCRQGKEKIFNFEKHRRVETYGRLVQQTGVIEPELLD